MIRSIMNDKLRHVQMRSSVVHGPTVPFARTRICPFVRRAREWPGSRSRRRAERPRWTHPSFSINVRFSSGTAERSVN